LRARHDAHDDTNDLTAGFAKLNPELEVLEFVPPTRSDTLIYLILSGAEAAELRAGMGEQYSRRRGRKEQRSSSRLKIPPDV
jgi:hypothetical protein